MRKFTHEELARYNGKDNNPAYVAVDGNVYDVTNSFLWRLGKHQASHYAGSDLTDKLKQAPHGMDVFKRVPVIGILVKS